jgi:predicted ATPase
LGVQRLKGFSYPLRIWRVLKAEQVASRFEAAHPTRLSPTVNREEEIAVLLRCWQKAKESQGQVVLLTGSSGIGKSHIIEALMKRITQEPHTRLRFQCSPYFSNTAFYPVINQFERVAGFQRDDSAAQKLQKLAQMLNGSVDNLAASVPLFAALLSIPTGNQYPPLDISPQRQKEFMFSALLEQLHYYQRRKPTLIICEDLHWIDPSSRELLTRLVTWASTARSIILLTSRNSFPTSWIEQRHVTLLALNRLSPQQCETLAKNVASGKTLPEGVLHELVSKSDGVPLFIEELTKATIYTGVLDEHSDHYELKGLLSVAAIPSTLQDSLTARLDQLSPAKAVAQTASVIGREFSYDLLATVMPLPKTKLLKALNQLIKAEVIFYFGTPSETMYVFKHALLQSAAYDSMVRSKRRLLHRDIGQAIEQHFPEILRKEPELVARHFSAAALPEKAVDYWLQAGQASSERSAYVEATWHLEEGLQVLASLPASPERDQRELALRIALGPALIFTKGAGTQEVEQVYRESLQLCARLPESTLHFAAYWGWWRISGNFKIMRERADQLLILAEGLNDPGLSLQAHHCQWAVLFHLGDYDGCRTHIEQGLSLYSSGDYRHHASIFGGHDPQVCAYGEQGQTLWLLGFPEQAREEVQKALAWAEQLRHSGSIVHALDMTLLVHGYRREANLVQTMAEKMIQFSDAHGLPDEWAKGMLFRGWAYAMTGQPEKGIAAIKNGLADLSQTGTKEDFPIYFDMLADAYQRAGDTEQALSTLAEALIQIKHTKSRYWEAEIYRHLGELLLASPTQTVTKAETCLTKALEIAHRQQAKSLELRAATSLAHLRRQQGQPHQGRAMLQSVYDWFTEGFESIDLKNAAALLREL